MVWFWSGVLCGHRGTDIKLEDKCKTWVILSNWTSYNSNRDFKVSKHLCQTQYLRHTTSAVMIVHQGNQTTPPQTRAAAAFQLQHSLNLSVSRSRLQEIFPVYFGSKYDAALEMLVWEFISRLEELLPVPDFTQVPCFFELGRVGISGSTSPTSKGHHGEGEKSENV